jgi:hypothetical protein
VSRPLWLCVWLVALGVAACSYDIDDNLCLDDDHCDNDEVCAVTNTCVPCAGDLCPPSERCEGDGDCGEEEVCADDHVCRPRCVVDAQCTTSGVCKEPVCAAAFGEPCNDSYDARTPCTDECIDTDNKLNPVPKYCSTGCFPETCPSGYECVSSSCRIISDGLLCQHPDPSGGCGACLWENCGSRLEDCCEGQICNDVFARVTTCDATRTNEACGQLEFTIDFEGTSSELLNCAGSYCDEGECFVNTQ